jgi:UDP-N-acetylmuramyl pentapeptide phosphotransferase/UDP-N-acetylglucosamine-1-phosphate transferase
MPIGFAITAILTLALSFACLNAVRDPKTWRLRWIDFLAIMDSDSDRDARKSHERQMAIMCGILCFLFIAVSFSCAYWAYVEVLENRREKSSIEREMEMGKKEVMKQSFRK